MKYLVQFAQIHPTFRLPELESVLKVLDLEQQVYFDRNELRLNVRLHCNSIMVIIDALCSVPSW